ncbi:MAG: hypothetical protein V4702_00080 [Patescibacteria group bacterium]
MKIELKNLPSKLKPELKLLRKYIVFGYFIALLMIFGFFVFRINQFSHTEPTEEAVQEKLQTVQRPKLDNAVLEKVEQLESQNIQVQSLFDQARNNPFNE